jgi:hypothetical protein
VRLVLLNAFPLSAFPYDTFTALFRRVTVEELARDAATATEVLCYIRHPATVLALQSLLNVPLRPSAELYRYREPDLMYVITLKTPQRGQEVAEVKLEDLDIDKVVVVGGAWI